MLRSRFICVRLPLALLLAIALAACGDGQSEQAPVRLRLAADREARAQGLLVIDFGVAEPGASSARSVELRNDGDVPLWVNGLRTEKGVAADDASPPFHLELQLPLELAPHATHRVEVQFHPIERGLSWQSTRSFVVDPADETTAAPQLVLRGATSPRPCALRVSPELSFGPVGPEGAVRAVSLENLGDDPFGTCVIRDPEIVTELGPSGNFELVDAESEITIAPGAKGQLAIRALANGSAAADAELRFTVADNVPRTVSVPLHAVFDADACVVLAPQALEFEEGVCTPRTKYVVLYNVCSEPVTFLGATLLDDGAVKGGTALCEGPEDCPSYRITSSPHPGKQVPAGGNALLHVNYLPTDIGIDVGLLEVRFAFRELESAVTASLRGHGRVSLPITDSYPVGPPWGGDLLLVIDNGPQMASFEPSLTTALDDVVRRLSCSCGDFNVGVITADVQPGSGAGALIADANGPAVLNPLTTPDFRNVLTDRLKVALTAGATATPLEAARRALSPPLSQGANAGFLRGEPLMISIYTSRSDASPLPVSDYEQAFATAQGAGPQGPIVSALGGFGDLSCGVAPDDGRLGQIVADTHGSAASLCNPGSMFCDGFCTTTFFLTHVPDYVTPIQLFVNGAPLPEVDDQGQPNWIYDSIQNAIEFPRAALQPKQSTLEVKYSASCWP